MELKGSTVCVSTLVKAHKDYYQVSLLTQLLHRTVESKLSFTFSPYKNLAISLTTPPPNLFNAHVCVTARKETNTKQQQWTRFL